MTKTMLSELHAGVLLVTHGLDAPTMEDWQAMNAKVANPEVIGSLVLVPPSCPGPNAAQRKIGADAWKARPRLPPLRHHSLHPAPGHPDRVQLGAG